MGAASAALERAHHLLQQDMYGYLDAVQELADESNVEDEDILVVAREHLPRLIQAVRGTLAKHEADVFGHCLGCPPGWTHGQYTRAVWPCGVVDQIYGFMVKPETVYQSMVSADGSAGNR